MGLGSCETSSAKGFHEGAFDHSDCLDRAEFVATATADTAGGYQLGRYTLLGRERLGRATLRASAAPDAPCRVQEGVNPEKGFEQTDDGAGDDARAPGFGKRDLHRSGRRVSDDFEFGKGRIGCMREKGDLLRRNIKKAAKGHIEGKDIT